MCEMNIDPTTIAGIIGLLGALLGAWIGREATLHAVRLQADRLDLSENNRTKREDEREQAREKRENEREQLRERKENERDKNRCDREVEREQLKIISLREIELKRRWIHIFLHIRTIQQILINVENSKLHLPVDVPSQLNGLYDNIKIQLEDATNKLINELIGGEGITEDEKQKIMYAIFYRHSRRDTADRLSLINSLLNELISLKVDQDMYRLLNRFNKRNF